MCMDVCGYVCTSIHIYICMYKHVCVFEICECRHAYVNMHMWACTYTCVYLYMCVGIYTCMRVCEVIFNVQ